jgi:site-specific DNA-adenine methylase
MNSKNNGSTDYLKLLLDSIADLRSKKLEMIQAAERVEHYAGEVEKEFRRLSEQEKQRIEPIYNEREAAKLCGYSLEHFRRMRRDGKFRGCYRREGNKVFYLESDIRRIREQWRRS